MFENRSDAGRRLAKLVGPLEPETTVVLALPRGGAPVAAEICAATGAPLDLLLVRKIGAPHQPELAIGAIAEGGDPLLNEALLDQLHLSEAERDAATAKARTELHERRERYMGGKERRPLAGRNVVLVDDGVATGATLKAGIAALRQLRVARLHVAVPVGAPEVLAEIETLTDRLDCVLRPAHLGSVGEYYLDFHQVQDHEVMDLLSRFGRAQSNA